MYSHDTIVAALNQHGGSRKDAAAALGIYVRRLQTMMAHYRRQGYTFPPPPKYSNGTHQFYKPTPREIADECAKIRQAWSEEEHRKRAGVQVEAYEIWREMRFGCQGVPLRVRRRA